MRTSPGSQHQASHWVCESLGGAVPRLLENGFGKDA